MLADTVGDAETSTPSPPRGVLERVSGGPAPCCCGEEPPFALRAHEAVGAKRRIAAEISALVADGESVLLDSGTTCLEVARLLCERPVTVMRLSQASLCALLNLLWDTGHHVLAFKETTA